MKIVIDIPEETYEVICRVGSGAPFVVDNAIRNGTLLPEGHGQLIDRDNLLRTLNEEHIEYDSDVNYFICHAPIIIEPDKEGE